MSSSGRRSESRACIAQLDRLAPPPIDDAGFRDRLAAGGRRAGGTQAARGAIWPGWRDGCRCRSRTSCRNGSRPICCERRSRRMRSPAIRPVRDRRAPARCGCSASPRIPSAGRQRRHRAGGPGALADAIVRIATALGADLRSNARRRARARRRTAARPVSCWRTATRSSARAVVAAISPKTALLQLVSPTDLPPTLRQPDAQRPREGCHRQDQCRVVRRSGIHRARRRRRSARRPPADCARPRLSGACVRRDEVRRDVRASRGSKSRFRAFATIRWRRPARTSCRSTRTLRRGISGTRRGTQARDVLVDASHGCARGARARHPSAGRCSRNRHARSISRSDWGIAGGQHLSRRVHDRSVLGRAAATRLVAIPHAGGRTVSRECGSASRRWTDRTARAGSRSETVREDLKEVEPAADLPARAL